MKSKLDKRSIASIQTLTVSFWSCLTEAMGLKVHGVVLASKGCRNPEENARTKAALEAHSVPNAFAWILKTFTTQQQILLCSYEALPKLDRSLFLKAQEFASDAERWAFNEEHPDYLDVVQYLVSLGGTDVGVSFPPETDQLVPLEGWRLFGGCLVGFLYEHMGTYPCKSIHAVQIETFVRTLIPLNEPFGILRYYEEPGAYVDAYYFILKAASSAPLENSRTQCPSSTPDAP